MASAFLSRRGFRLCSVVQPTRIISEDRHPGGASQISLLGPGPVLGRRVSCVIPMARPLPAPGACLPSSRVVWVPGTAAFQPVLSGGPRLRLAPDLTHDAWSPFLKVKGSYHEAGKRYVDIQVVPMHSIATRGESDVSDLSRGRIFEPMYLLGWKPEDPTPPELDEEKPLRGVVGYSGCTRFDPIRLPCLPQRRHVLSLNSGLRGPNWSSHGSILKPNVGFFKVMPYLLTTWRVCGSNPLSPGQDRVTERFLGRPSGLSSRNLHA